jgi:hypothetical protein
LLNELADLRRSLAEQGIQTAPWYPSLQPLRKGIAVIVELDVEGSPAHVSSLLPAQTLELRNIQPDNQNRFPAFNLDCPLFRYASLATTDLDILDHCLRQPVWHVRRRISFGSGARYMSFLPARLLPF